GKRRRVGLEACIVGAGHGAVSAADAEVVVDGDDAVGALARRGTRTHLQARRVVAMHAARRHERALHVRKLAHLQVEHLAPLHARRGRVGVLAGRGAGLAPDAALQVRHHHPARHDLLSETRTTSAAEPVASVSESDMGTSGFMEGMPKSLASGVAQWPNWPTRRSVSGRIPWRSTALARTERSGVAISTQSPSSMPSSPAFPALRITPSWPAMFPATSRIICTPTLPPQAYCIERAVRSQKG